MFGCRRTLLSLHNLPRIGDTEVLENNEMEVAVEVDGSVRTSSPALEGLEHRGSEISVEVDGVTANDSEVVCNGHSDNGNSEESKALKEEKEQLERKCASLQFDNERLGSECTQLLATNSQLVLDNSHLEAQKFGANLIQDDNKKTLFYTGLPTYKIFSTLFDLLQPYYSLYWHGTPNIDQIFAVLMYLRLHTPMDDLAYRFKISNSQLSRLFHSWMDTM